VPAPGAGFEVVSTAVRKLGAAARPGTRARDARRLRFLLALRELDAAWLETFHETGFSDVYFSRLFSELWMRGDDVAVTKSDAYGMVKGVGLQTAMKYVRRAIDEGHLLEVDHPADGRSKLLRMSPDLRERFEQMIDRAWVAFDRAFDEDA
jgi:hypothetical protein